MSAGLTDYELDLLRCLNGEDVPGLRWGAAMSVSVEYLYHRGYATRKISSRGIEYVITEKGKAALTGGSND